MVFDEETPLRPNGLEMPQVVIGQLEESTGPSTIPSTVLSTLDLEK
jgi:hypothetical protein